MQRDNDAKLVFMGAKNGAQKIPKTTVKAPIRAAVEKAYDAFVKPGILSKFWFSAASGPLEVGKTVHWEFMVAGVADHVTAIELIPNQSGVF